MIGLGAYRGTGYYLAVSGAASTIMERRRSTAHRIVRRGLVDEIPVYVLPVLLGDGIRFSSPGLARIDLEPVSSTWSGAITILRFRVRK